MAYLVECSTKGGAMHLFTHGTTGGVAVGGATNDTTGLKADEAPLITEEAPSSSTLRSLVASASAVSDTSKWGAGEIGHSASTQTKGS